MNIKEVIKERHSVRQFKDLPVKNVKNQKFHISLDGDKAVITTKGGPMTQLDLGIVKYNFEAASGHKI